MEKLLIVEIYNNNDNLIHKFVKGLELSGIGIDTALSTGNYD